MRFGENAYRVIEETKKKLDQLRQGLPPGVDIRTEYDRSALIERAVDTLKRKLLEEMTVVSLIITLFLLHFRGSLVAIFVLPAGVLAAVILMNIFGINANIMSLGGIALAIGVMVDSSVIMIENAHKHLEHDRGQRTHAQVIIDASKEVGPQLFFSLLIITVSFVPIFSLTGQSGRLMKPLAFTKTFALGAAALLSITIIPVLMEFFVRGKIPDEQNNPVGRFLQRIYGPLFWLALKGRVVTLAVADSLQFGPLLRPIKRSTAQTFVCAVREGALMMVAVSTGWRARLCAHLLAAVLLIPAVPASRCRCASPKVARPDCCCGMRARAESRDAHQSGCCQGAARCHCCTAPAADAAARSDTADGCGVGCPCCASDAPPAVPPSSESSGTHRVQVSLALPSVALTGRAEGPLSQFPAAPPTSLGAASSLDRCIALSRFTC